ncbi:MAG: phosphonate ABC transporter, permease protein PhnE [Alphaproteobacteria bacterium]|nr:phosphonate ABC transporter, permease protein PhnE [Alphaproteobacteria bacterium]
MIETHLSASQLQREYGLIVRKKRLYSFILLILFFSLMATGFVVAEDRNAGGFLDGLSKLFDFPNAVISEAFAEVDKIPGLMLQYLPDLIETVNIAAASTLIGAVLGALISMLVTRGFSKYTWIIPIFRRLLDIMRAVPEVVIALVLIFVMGGGPVPAMVAIAFHTTGALGKMFSEVNENASLKPVEGLESVGANWLQRMGLGVMPQVAPNYLSYALLRFEINIRASAILGFVGAGGIGYELKNAITWGMGRFDQAAAIFILIFITIVFFDQISSHFRGVLAHGRS